MRVCGLDGCDVDISDRLPHTRFCCKRHGRLHRKVTDQALSGRAGNRTCERCGNGIDHKPVHARFCGESCQSAAWKANHPEQRRVSAEVYGKSYREANRSTLLASSHRYEVEHREQRRAASRVYETLNRERRLATHRADYRAHRAERVAYARRYNPVRVARVAGAVGSVPVLERDWLRLIRRYDGRCAYCGIKPLKLTRDHVVPVVRGGRHGIGNLLPACGPCNDSKGSKLLAVWRRDLAKRRVIVVG